MALILHIETSTIACSVSLAKGGNVLACKELSEKNIHASLITVFIQEIMQLTGLTLRDVDAIAVSKGPGSYTGLRIGVSTAKGLCYALDRPLIAVDTLKAMAWKASHETGSAEMLYCPMIDARRMEVYTAIYNIELSEVQPVQARIIEEGSFSDILNKYEVLFFGDGALKCRDAIGNPDKARFITDFQNSALHMIELALDKYNKQQFENLAYFEPYYLKDFIANGIKL